MTGLSKEICFSISRLQTEFVDSLGHNLKGLATGVWVLTEKGNRIFVTNKHNLDVNMIYGLEEKYKLSSLELELRKKEEKKFISETKFFPINLAKSKIIYGDTIDLALIINPKYVDYINSFDVNCLDFSAWIPDEDFFVKRCRLASDVSFVGYPINLFDSKWKLPIARHAVIASVSEIDFSHEEIESKGIILVSGLSFGGGSGSPVFSSLRGLRINCDNGFVESDDYCPQKLLGVMTGHLQLQPETEKYMTKKEKAFILHSGLSYFTNILSLIKLIKDNDL